jgi:hypothetical protein
MKKLVLSVSVVLASMTAKAQWAYQNVDNGIDDPYKIAYTTKEGSEYLKIENLDGELAFYLTGSYFCEETPEVDIVFVVNGQNKKYKIIATKSTSSKTVYFTFNLMNETYIEDFKNASSVKVRVNETYCTTDVFTFSMDKSKSAVEFMLKP